MIDFEFFVKFPENPEKSTIGINSFDELIDVLGNIPKNVKYLVFRQNPINVEKAKFAYFHGIEDAQAKTISSIYAYSDEEWAYHEGREIYEKTK